MILFYRHDGDAPVRCDPDTLCGLDLRIWQPAVHGRPPRGSRSLRNLFWWMLTRLGLFATSDFSEITLWRDERVVHRLIVTPRWLRFPFMHRDDLQIGDLWTRPQARSKGLARAAIAAAHAHFTRRKRRFWYLVDSDNSTSIRLIESCGYRMVGRGSRTSPLGLRLAGRFRLDAPIV